MSTIGKIGFIGLGQMGKWMALNLLKKGFYLQVYDVDPGAVDRLAEQGAAKSNSPAELAAQVEMIILSLPNEAVVQKVIFGANGIIENARAGLIVVDCGTSGYLWTRQAAADLAKKDLHLLDAPVTGLEQRARDAKLTIMVGGPERLLPKIHPALRAMGDTIIHMGAVGNGQLAKMVNNVIYNANMATLAEMLPLAAKLGLDPEKIAGVVNSGSGRSFASSFFLPKILADRFSDAYSLDQAHKDMQNIAAIAARHKWPLPMVQAAHGTYRKALDMGLGTQDKGAMIKVFEQALDVRFRAAPTPNEAESDQPHSSHSHIKE